VVDWVETWGKVRKGRDGKQEEEMKSKHGDRRPKKVGYVSMSRPGII
jgi:hypothetical protein